MVGLTLTGIFAGVAVVRAILFRDRGEARQATVFVSLLAGMLLATLINPRGIGLHSSTSRDPGTDVSSPPRRLGQSRLSQPHRVGLLLRSAPADDDRVARDACAEARLGGGRASGWASANEALHSVRHINLFAIVAAPIIARETPRDCSPTLWPAFDARCREIEGDTTRPPRPRSPRAGLICVVFLGLTSARVLPFPESGPHDLQLSRGAAQYIANHQDRFGRMFNTDNLGGSLFNRFWPTLHVFVDDRIPVYGDDFLLKRYLPGYYAHKDWRRALSKYRITSAVAASLRTARRCSPRGTRLGAGIRRPSECDLPADDPPMIPARVARPTRTLYSAAGPPKEDS